jgi:hypothetical protein
VHGFAAEVEPVPGSILILALLVSLLVLCGLLAHRGGWDSRDGFADQAHRPSRQYFECDWSRRCRHERMRS